MIHSFKLLTVALTTALLAGAASADITTFNSSVNPGWGVGNGQPNSGFVVNTNNGIETGLSSFYRFLGGTNNAITSNVYEFNRGASPTSGIDPTPVPALAAWNAQFHVNLGSRNFSTTLVQIVIDWDPTAGVDAVTYNLSAALGNNANLSIYQGSQNLGFAFWGHAFNPNATGEYNISILTRDLSLNVLSSVDMVVQVVPLPPAAIAGCSALACVAGVGLIRRRRAAAI